MLRRILSSVILSCACAGSYFAGIQGGHDSLMDKIQNATGLEKAKAYNIAAATYKATNPDTALFLSQQALSINARYKNEAVTADAFGAIAESYLYKSRFDSAVSYYIQAIKIAEKLNNLKKMASFYNGLGIVFYQLGDFEKSIAYMKKAAEIKLRQGDMLYYATINTNISGVMQRFGQYKEAIALLRNSEARLKNFDNIEILANLYNSLGSAYQLGSHNLDSAEYYYKKNISLITRPEHEAYRFAAYRNLGEIYSGKGDFKNAELNLFKALEIAEKLGRSIEKIGVYESISALYEKKSDYKTALFYKSLQLRLKDSVFTEDKERVIHDLEARYQVEKKDLTIKSQELLLEKEKNKKNAIIFISILLILVLLTGVSYFWLSRRTKDALEKAKSKMFQNIVHEIRTPLTLIAGPLEMIKRSNLDEQSRQHLVLISQNSEKLILLADELVTALLLEKEKYTISPVTGDIILYAKNILQQLDPEAAKHEVELLFNPAQPAAIISFEARAFEKILNNLVINAIKYNKAGGSVEVLLDAGSTGIHLTVKDTGAGIRDADKKRLFERFYRADGQKDKPGFGIGLSIVNDLVKLLKGKITLQSEVGKGSSFSVSLPPISASPGQSFLPADSEATPGALMALVVEDDDGIFQFIKNILSANKIEAIRASDGLSGYQLALEIIPDVIITDVMMPLEDGIGMTRRLKSEGLLNHIPVIMLSSKTSMNSRVEGMSAGADAYLNKPFHPDELLLLVQNLLQTLNNNRSKFSQQLQASPQPFDERVAGNDAYLKKIVGVVNTNILVTGFSVNELASAMCISRSQLHRKITALTGLSTTHFIRVIRLEKAKDLLLSNSGNITEIAYQCGFNSQSYFTKSFTEHFGSAPSSFLK